MNVKFIGSRLVNFFFTKKVTLFRWQLNILGVVVLSSGIIIGTYATLSKVISPLLSALVESTYTVGNGGNSAFSGGSGVGVEISASEISLSMSDDWYNLNWLYRKQLTITNKSGVLLPTNTSVQFSIDTKSLYDASKVKTNCEDLRVIYYPNGGSVTEIGRSYYVASGATNCSDSTATIVTFPLQSDVDIDASTSDYYIYYGNSSASSPSANLAQGYNVGSANATLVCPFNGNTTCMGQSGSVSPSTATGAIRYSGGKGAISFDGSNDYMTVTTGSSLTITNNLTLEGWVYVNGSASDLDHVFGRYTTNGYAMYLNSGAIRFQIDHPWQHAVQASLSANAWHHVAGTYDGATLKLFVDGVLKSKMDYVGSIANGGNFMIGRNSDGVYYYRGNIDEIRVSDTIRYGASCTTLNETCFTSSTTPFEPDANTKLLLHFDENGDDPRNTGKAIDSSGNGNHGTITGAKYIGGLVGVDASSSDTGQLPIQSYAGHSGVFAEEGTTNLVTNPSFENATAYNTNWGLNYFNYSSSADTFTANMAKRNSAGPFAAGVLTQGHQTGATVDGNASSSRDALSFSSGNQVSGKFYQNWDSNQGTITFWFTPEWNGNDGASHGIFDLRGSDNTEISIAKNSSNYLSLWLGSQSLANAVDVSSWVAGNTYQVTLRWDSKNTLNGTNYLCFSIDDTHTCAITSAPTMPTPQTNYIGQMLWSTPANGIFEGFTIYRRPLFDGTYGIDVGNGDEVNQIYNSGTGKDPTLVTGSWDVVFALPTNASTGTLTTGTGNAWSHPHASNLLYTSTTNTGGFMMNGTYISDGFADLGTPTSVGALATGEKIFSGGYKYTSDAADEGVYRSFTVTSGGDYVLRALGHSDGTCNPQVKITRADGTTEISHLNGTTTSRRATPDVYVFTWESPAAEDEQIQLINTASSGTCYWHQVEVQLNSINNPSMETGSGDPWFPTGFSNQNHLVGELAQSTSDFRTGSSAWQKTTTTASRQAVFTMNSNNILSVGKFFSIGAAFKTMSSAFLGIHECPSPYRNFGVTSLNQGSWKYSFNVTTAPTPCGSYPSGGQVFFSGSGLVDDFYLFKVTDVSLTVTPASEANSNETSGLRVDGKDTLTQPITGLSASSGEIKFKFTPRHSAADVEKFGVTQPQIARFVGDGDDYISLSWGVPNQIYLGYNAGGAGYQGSQWVATGAIVAGTTYNVDIVYTPSQMVLKVDGTARITK